MNLLLDLGITKKSGSLVKHTSKKSNKKKSAKTKRNIQKIKKKKLDKHKVKAKNKINTKKNQAQRKKLIDKKRLKRKIIQKEREKKKKKRASLEKVRKKKLLLNRKSLKSSFANKHPAKENLKKRKHNHKKLRKKKTKSRAVVKKNVKKEKKSFFDKLFGSDEKKPSQNKSVKPSIKHQKNLKKSSPKKKDDGSSKKKSDKRKEAKKKVKIKKKKVLKKKSTKNIEILRKKSLLQKNKLAEKRKKIRIAKIKARKKKLEMARIKLKKKKAEEERKKAKEEKKRTREKKKKLRLDKISFLKRKKIEDERKKIEKIKIDKLKKTAKEEKIISKAFAQAKKDNQKFNRKIKKSMKDKQSRESDRKITSFNSFENLGNKKGKKGKLSDLEKKKVKGELPRVKLGIPGFDELLSRGIPEGAAVLVEGGPGSGKTIFCLQIAHNACLQGKKVLYMTFEEPENRLRNHMNAFGWDCREAERKGKLFIRKFNSLDVARSVEALLSEAKRELLIDIQPVLIPKEFKPDIVCIDSLSSIASAFSGEDARFRIYMEQLFRYLESHDITSFLIRETSQPTHVGVVFSEKGEAVSFLSDGIIVLYNVIFNNGKRGRALEILKMRGEDIDRRIVHAEIFNKKGFIIQNKKYLSMEGSYRLT